SIGPGWIDSAEGLGGAAHATITRMAATARTIPKTDVSVPKTAASVTGFGFGATSPLLAARFEVIGLYGAASEEMCELLHTSPVVQKMNGYTRDYPEAGTISPLSVTSVAAKPKTAIVKNIFVSVGICAKTSIPRQHDSISLLIFWLKALTSSPASKRACAIRL